MSLILLKLVLKMVLNSFWILLKLVFLFFFFFCFYFSFFIFLNNRQY